MISRIDKFWRVIATGLAFLAFGVGGILLQIFGIPLLYLLFPQQQPRQRAARRLVRAMFWLFVRFIWVMGVLRFHMVCTDRLDRPGLVIVANHPTLLDVVFLLSVVPNATCIVRAGLSSNPFTRAAVSLTGYVCNDSGVELVDDCVGVLRSGSSLIIFPEGTRTNPVEGQKWHRGAANVALRAGTALTPVQISCDPPTLRKGEPWWHVPPRRMRYLIKVLDDLPVSSDSSSWEADVRTARSLTDRLKELLSDRVERNAGA
jgi:1-acyl-sn-glycerol-3-phosphate acyltransferase